MTKQQDKEITQEITQEEIDRREVEHDKAQRDSIMNRYHRPVIAFPDGAVVHHGDCQIFDEWGVCTCGLLHDLIWCHSPVANELYPDYGKDRAKHEHSMYELMAISRSGRKQPPPPTPEQQREMIAALFGPGGMFEGQDPGPLLDIDEEPV